MGHSAPPEFCAVAVPSRREQPALVDVAVDTVVGPALNTHKHTREMAAAVDTVAMDTAVMDTLVEDTVEMNYVTNLMDVDVDPGQWGRRREDQGWQILSVADHFFTKSRPFPHVWVTAAALAAATKHATITTAFTNNLFRSPVEVAQAALQMQNVADGRFELGLGAGWYKGEMEGAGLAYPEARDRAGAFIEAVQIVRELLHKGACTFDGDYYDIDVPFVGPLSDNPPALVGSVGGPRTVKYATPHLDRVEIKASSASTRGGVLDLGVMAAIPDEHLIDMIARVRDVDTEIEIGLFVLCNAAEDEFTRGLQAQMGSNLYSRFFGPPAHVVEGLAWLADLGVSRAQLSPFDDASLDRLAPLLF